VGIMIANVPPPRKRGAAVYRLDNAGCALRDRACHLSTACRSALGNSMR